MCKELLELEQKGMNLPTRRNGKPRIFCKPEMNERATSFLDLPIYNTDIADDDPVRKTRAFKSYRLFGLCFKTSCSK